MTNETKNTGFLSRLEQIIIDTGLDKKVFAKKCGISPNQLYNYLNGSQEPGSKFYRGLKSEYPNVSVDWLIAGQGLPYIEPESELSVLDTTSENENVVDIQHSRVIKKFKDREYALEINRALLVIEKKSQKVFYEVGGYIKRAATETGEEKQDSEGKLRNGTTDAKK